MRVNAQPDDDPILREEKIRRCLESLAALQAEVQRNATRLGLTMREVAIDLGFNPDELVMDADEANP